MSNARNQTPRSALLAGIVLCVFFFGILYIVHVNPFPSDSKIVLILITLLVITAGAGVTLIAVAIYFVSRRGYRWGDNFIPEVMPRNTGVSRPAYGVERPNARPWKVCPACDARVASESKVCPNFGELFADLPPE